MGVEQRLVLPSRRFHRNIGIHANVHSDPEGRLISKDEFDQRRDAWLPSASDQAYVKSLMVKPVTTPGQMANWIAAPAQGIKGRPADFEYVRTGET
jgi:benzoyl-CoA 2,3-dioxygenase component B